MAKPKWMSKLDRIIKVIMAEEQCGKSDAVDVIHKQIEDLYQKVIK